MKSQSLWQIAEIGTLLQSLTIPPRTAERADETINQILTLLGSVDLPHTLGAAQQFQSFQRTASSGYPRTSGMANAHDLELKVIAQTVIAALRHETSQQYVITLDPSAITESLKKIPDGLPQLTDSQLHLVSETIRCLESGAYRAAIVMAWNFAFDYVRDWSFKNHLPVFNQTLTTKYLTKRGGQQQAVYAPIQQYSDFWENNPYPGERVVIDTCNDANIITGKAYDSLVVYLRRRNDYAHPNFLT